MSKELSTSKILPKIVVIVGPTASGKSDLAIKIAKKYKGEIISADSRQIYRGMDIGTAKPVRDHANAKRINVNKSQMAKNGFANNSRPLAFYSHGITHHLINIKNPNEEYNVAEYKKDSVRVIEKILEKKKLPILVGGTGLYIKAVADNLKIPRMKTNPALREKLEKEIKEKGIEHLYNRLIKLDPEAAYIIDPKNPRRIVRALEIILGTNKPFSKQREVGEKLFDVLKIGLTLPKEKLKERIFKRVDKMIKDGLVDEVKSLLEKYPVKSGRNSRFETDSRKHIREGFEKKYPLAFDAIGYREIINCFKFQKSLKDAVAEIKQNTWHYAKRQLTWFRTDKEIKWVKNQKEALGLANKFLKDRFS